MTWTKISDRPPTGDVLLFNVNGNAMLRVEVAEDTKPYYGGFTHWTPWTEPTGWTQEDHAWKKSKREYGWPTPEVEWAESGFRAGFRAAKREVVDVKTLGEDVQGFMIREGVEQGQMERVGDFQKGWLARHRRGGQR